MTAWFASFAWLVAVGLQTVSAQSAGPTPPAVDGNRGHGKFIQTFTVKLRGGEKIVPGDEKLFGRFDLVLIARTWSTAIRGDTWKAIHGVNPATELFIQTEGPTLWKAGDKFEIRDLKDVGRYDVSRGHSMGAINRNHPEFFLLDKDGQRCLAYKPEYSGRFLMDFGSRDYQNYWVEAITADVLQQPWRGAGIHIDNTGPVCTFPTDKPAKYDTDEKWGKAALSFVDNVTRAMHQEGCKVWINAGGTDNDRGWRGLVQLDALANPPDVVGEEGAFATDWGKGDTTFPAEGKWRHSVDFLGKLRKSRQAYFSHTKLPVGGTGTDNSGQPVTYWQSLWYSLCSYLLGKDDQLNNAYFFFHSSAAGYGGKDWWYDEYDRINLGMAVGPYNVTWQRGANIYTREFVRGYVLVNPSDVNATGIVLSSPGKELNHDNLRYDPETLPNVSRLDLKAHHGAILLRVHPRE